MPNFIDQLKYNYRTGTMVTRLLFVNIGVFAVLKLIHIFSFFFRAEWLKVVMPWISGTSDWQTMLYRPWTIITYMFVHEGVMHILFNLLVFYFAGRIFENLLNGKRLLGVYFLGGIAGFLFYFAAYNLLPVFSGTQSIIFGASASIIAILVAIATYMPDLEVRLILIGNVELKYIAIFFVALDILFIDGGNSGGRIAHLGGALFGFLYSMNLKKGNDWTNGFYAVTNFFSDLIKPRPKMKVASKSKGTKAKAYANKKDDAEAKKHTQKIDSILDKISRSGYDSLTKSEKEYLFNSSKK